MARAIKTPIMPSAVDLEEVVLGAIIVDRNCLGEVLELLKGPQYFYKTEHGFVFKAILDLNRDGKPIDLLTVTQQLRVSGTLEEAGGAYGVTKLLNRISSAAHAQYHAAIIAQHYVKRRMYEICAKLGMACMDETTDFQELLNEAQAELTTLSDGLHSKAGMNAADLIKIAVENLELASNDPKGLVGLSTGFREMDELTAGLKKTLFYVLAGRPGMGKTIIALIIAIFIASMGEPVDFYSLEMSGEELINRAACSIGGIDNELLLHPRKMTEHDWARLIEAKRKIEALPLYIDDTPGLSMFEFQTKARKRKKHNNTALIIFDYIQLANGRTSDRQNREQEVSYIARTLKNTAKELEIPVMGLAQLSRNVEGRSDKMPQLSDLKESGGIEEAADAVIFAYRPSYYGIVKDGEGNYIGDITKLIFAKHRGGRTGEVKLRHNLALYQFYDLDEQPERRYEQRDYNPNQYIEPRTQDTPF